MTNHIILPASMIKVLLIHMFHRPSIAADVKVWVYGDGRYAEDIDMFNELLGYFQAVIPYVPIMDIDSYYKIEDKKIDIKGVPGINTIYKQASDIVRNNKFGEIILPDDRVNIIATSTLWLALAIVLKREKILNHAARIISLLPLNNAAIFENLKLLCQEFKNAVRIDIVNEGRCSDILAAARVVEAMEPPEEPDGIYITTEKYSPFYISDEDLPTLVTGMSIRIIYHLKTAFECAVNDEDFLKRTRVGNSFKDYEPLKKIRKILLSFTDYLESLSNRFRCNFVPTDISKILSKISPEPEGLSVKHYCKVALKYLILSSMDVLSTVDMGKNFDESPMQENQFEYDDFSNCINPFFIIDKTQEAFKGMAITGISLRSACLDAWEYVMNSSSLPNFQEIKIRPDSPEWSKLAFFKGSEAVKSQKVCFMFEIENYGLIITSPYTGFAVSKPSGATNRELVDRDPIFKRFIYDYVMNVPGFSSEFKEYVSNACSTDETSTNNKSFFENYPEFGKNIPIYT